MTTTSTRTTSARSRTGSEVTSTTPGETQNPVASAADDATQAASRVADSARRTITERANTERSRAADGITQAAGAMHRVAGELQTEQPAIASIANGAADGAERIGRYLRETDVNDILNTTQDFARRQPLLFYGGAFALGIIAARVLKSAAGTPQAGSRAAYWRSSSTVMAPTGPGTSTRSLTGTTATGTAAS